MNKSRLVTIFWILSPAAWAQTDLFSLPLKELLQIKVFTPSKLEASQVHSPAAITVITAAEIRGYGANTLIDVLRRAPSIYPLSSYILRDEVMSIRGQSASAVDRRVLLLLNGRPFIEGSTGGVNSLMYRNFPLDIIEQIEVIRGPGSVLYGSNAVSGVINIITKTSPQNGATASGGSFDTYQLSATQSIHTDAVDINLALHYLNSDGWDFTSPDLSGQVETVPFSHEDLGLFLDMDWEGLRVQYYRAEIDEVRAAIGAQGFRWPETTYDKQRQMLDLTYETSLNENWNLSSSATYNDIYRKTADNRVEVKGDNLLFELNTNGQLTDPLSFVSGISLHSFSGQDLTPAGRGWEIEWHTFHYQLNYRAAPELTLVWGQHYNVIKNTVEEDSTKHNDWSSRASIIWQPNETWHTKLLWAEAFRSPFGAELSANFASLVGNPNIAPEKVETREFQVGFTPHKAQLLLTVFESEYTDGITTDRSTFPGTFANNALVNYEGAEFEWQWEVRDDLRIQGSWSYQTNENDDGREQNEIVPERMVKIGMLWNPRQNWRLGIFNAHIGKLPAATNFNPNAQTVNPDTEAYDHLSLNIEWDVSHSIQAPGLTSTKVILFGDNLLESNTVYSTETGFYNFNTLPDRAGRNIHLKLQVNW